MAPATARRSSLKTNVWRIYESLDLDDPTVQVACYDDGVGTSSFKPLALLGGTFGVGLARNVLRLYRFTCEHYEPGDRIYAFGFSRGAFTIRVLVALICDQGIIKTRPPVAGPLGRAAAPDEGDAVYGSELGRLAGWAYREYRRQFTQRFGLVGPARTVRDVIIRRWERVRGRKPYDKKQNRQVAEIAFVGVWDTVDAYGLPIDELTDGVDRWVWPLSMQNLRLSDKVGKACHVLALDDERNTFHPVLWDESTESQSATDIEQERISQVWFAGMHSNVGGGYPDDALACVSFQWMTRQAGARGLPLPGGAAHPPRGQGRPDRPHLRLQERPQGLLPLQPTPDRMAYQRPGARACLLQETLAHSHGDDRPPQSARERDEEDRGRA